jgi:hypothetical protein
MREGIADIAGVADIARDRESKALLRTNTDNTDRKLSDSNQPLTISRVETMQGLIVVCEKLFTSVSAGPALL